MPEENDAPKEVTDETLNEIESSDYENTIASEPATGLDADVVNTPVVTPSKNKFVRFLKSWWSKVALVVLLVIAIFAVPMTRYALMGFFVTKTVTVSVVDSTTGKPVSDAIVHLGRQDGKTDAQGLASISNAAVGDHSLVVEKKNYETSTTSYLVPIIFGVKNDPVKLKATGRLFSVTVTNSISDKAVSNASVIFGDVSAKTDSTGLATVSLPVTPAQQDGTISADGYNPSTISFDANKGDNQTVAMTLSPSGTVYFLSNRNGTYDVMSASLDGSSPEVVLKGTGKEVQYELQLFASPSRDTLAYYARRDAARPMIYIIDTATNTVTDTIDSGSSSMNPIGWMGNTFYYTLYTQMSPVADGRNKLIAYSAAAKQNTTVDQSHVTGDATNPLEESLSSRFQIANNRIYYAKCWSYVSYAGAAAINQQMSFVSVADGKATVLKTVDQTSPSYCDTVVKQPNIVNFKVTNAGDGTNAQYFTYERGKTVISAQLGDADFATSTNFLTSLSGNKTFWTETRDGKKVSFEGDASGGSATQVSGTDYTAYGWIGDDYVLYSKGGSELFIAAAGAQLDGTHKITDYFSSSSQQF